MWQIRVCLYSQQQCYRYRLEISKSSDKSWLYFCLPSLFKLSIFYLFWPFFMCFIHSFCSANIWEYHSLLLFHFSLWITYSWSKIQSLSPYLPTVHFPLLPVHSVSLSLSLCHVCVLQTHKHCHTHCRIKSLVGLLLGRCQPTVIVVCCEWGITAFLPVLLLLLSYMDFCQWISSPVSRPYLTSFFLFLSACHLCASSCLLSHSAHAHMCINTCTQD